MAILCVGEKGQNKLRNGLVLRGYPLRLKETSATFAAEACRRDSVSLG